MTVTPGASGKFVQLNVGGTVFRTTLATLEGGSSMLSKMFSGQMEPGLRDEEGRVYIDRDPKHFGVILNCLRCGGGADAAAKLLPVTRAEQRELLLEAQYYGCEGLVAALEEAEKQWAGRELYEDKRTDAATHIDINRAALLRYALTKKVEADKALEQAQAELAEVKLEAQRLDAAAPAAAPAELAENERAACHLIESAVAARKRGTAAAQQRMDAQALRLAALGGGAEPAALALWSAEQAATKGELDSAEHVIRQLLWRHLDGAMPPLAELDSDDDDEEARAAANVQRFRAAPEAAEAAGGHAGALDELNRLLHQAGLGNEEAEGQDDQPPGMLLELDDSEDEGALAPLP